MKEGNIVKLNKIIQSVYSLEVSEATEVSKLLLKEASGEYMNFRKDFFSKPEVIQQIISLGQNNVNSSIILRNVILTLGHIARIYYIHCDSSYKFIFQHIKDTDKDTKLAVARFITIFPQFEDYEYKWDYILSIPNIAPQKISREYFISCILKESKKSIPANYANQIVIIITGFINKYSLDEDTYILYNNLIDLIKMKN